MGHAGITNREAETIALACGWHVEILPVSFPLTCLYGYDGWHEGGKDVGPVVTKSKKKIRKILLDAQSLLYQTWQSTKFRKLKGGGVPMATKKAAKKPAKKGAKKK
jgi:hypothetical protein